MNQAYTETGRPLFYRFHADNSADSSAGFNLRGEARFVPLEEVL